MQIKGFENKTSTIETPNDSGSIEKKIKKKIKKNQRVDINVLKSRLRDKENIILRRNIIILLSCMALLVTAGIFVTYL